jgi:hypothetical protein
VLPKVIGRAEVDGGTEIAEVLGRTFGPAPKAAVLLLADVRLGVDDERGRHLLLLSRLLVLIVPGYERTLGCLRKTILGNSCTG